MRYNPFLVSVPKNVPEKTIERNLERLKTEVKTIRISPTIDGYWQVLEGEQS